MIDRIKGHRIRNVDESSTAGSAEPSSKPSPVVADGSSRGSDADGIPERRAARSVSPVSRSVRDCDRRYLVAVDSAVAFVVDFASLCFQSFLQYRHP